MNVRLGAHPLQEGFLQRSSSGFSPQKRTRRRKCSSPVTLCVFHKAVLNNVRDIFFHQKYNAINIFKFNLKILENIKR